MIVKYRNKTGLVFLLALLLISCATIPKEAVVLNQEVGKRIESTYAAYLNLLNYFFEQRRNRIDETMNSYTESLNNNIKKQLHDGVTEIPIDKMGDILKKISERRDMLHEELEKTRILLVDQLNKDHMQVMQANSNITAILQSFVDVDEGMRAVTTKSFKAIGVDLKLDDITELLDNQLIEAGKIAGEATETYKKIKSLFQKEED